MCDLDANSVEQEKLSQVKAVVKVRPKQDKLFSKKGAKLDKLLLVKGKSAPSRLKSKVWPESCTLFSLVILGWYELGFSVHRK